MSWVYRHPVPNSTAFLRSGAAEPAQVQAGRVSHPSARMPTSDSPTKVDFSRNVVCIMGLPFDIVDTAQAVDLVRQAALQRKPCLISTANLNFVVAARADEVFRESVIHSQLCLADGMPIIWVARMLGLPLRERVAGAGLFEALLQSLVKPAVKIFFFGGADGVAQEACDRINQREAGVHCVGCDSPGFVSVEAMSGAEHIDRINRADPDFVVVSLGAKKGQAWIERNRSQLNAPVISHLGAVVNFAAESIQRAPVWMQRFGMEWLWRIKEEPSLWRRYTADAAAFARILADGVLPLWWEKFRTSQNAASAAPSVETSTQEGRHQIKLTGVLDNRCIEHLRHAFTQAAAASAVVRLDFSNVLRIDAAAMGMLLLLHGHQRDIGRGMELHGLSEALRRQFRYHGAGFLLTNDSANLIQELMADSTFA